MATRATQRGLNLPPPTTLENELARKFGKLNKEALRAVEEFVIPAIKSGDPARLEEALRVLQDVLDQHYGDGRVAKEAQAVAERVNNNHRKLFFAGLGAAVGLKLLGSDNPKASIVVPGLPGTARRKGGLVVLQNANPELAVDRFIKENTRLIKTLREGVVEGVRSVIAKAAAEGVDSDELARRILTEFKKQGVPSTIPTSAGPRTFSVNKHATLIARDQIAKLNGQVSRERQMAAGIRKFVWETQKDSRVRPEHRALQGREFTWEEGWNGIFPGQPINCRCWARAVVQVDVVEQEGNFVNLRAS